MATITVRLLIRSASTPAGSEISIRGIIRTIWAIAVRSCPSAWFAAAATARSTTICFQALSLNAPRNCATNSPPMGCFATMAGPGCRLRSAPMSTSPAPFQIMPTSRGRHESLMLPSLSWPKRRKPSHGRGRNVWKSPSGNAIPTRHPACLMPIRLRGRLAPSTYRNVTLTNSPCGRILPKPGSAKANSAARQAHALLVRNRPGITSRLARMVFRRTEFLPLDWETE